MTTIALTIAHRSQSTPRVRASVSPPSRDRPARRWDLPGRSPSHSATSRPHAFAAEAVEFNEHRGTRTAGPPLPRSRTVVAISFCPRPGIAALRPTVATGGKGPSLTMFLFCFVKVK